MPPRPHPRTLDAGPLDSGGRSAQVQCHLGRARCAEQVEPHGDLVRGVGNGAGEAADDRFPGDGPVLVSSCR
jgi:hypothetical protein